MKSLGKNLYKSAKRKKLNITSELKSTNNDFSYYLQLIKQIKKIQDICNKNSASPFQSTTVSNVVTLDSNLQVVDVTDNSNMTSFISTPEDNNTNTQYQKVTNTNTQNQNVTTSTPFNRK